MRAGGFEEGSDIGGLWSNSQFSIAGLDTAVIPLRQLLILGLSWALDCRLKEEEF